MFGPALFLSGGDALARCGAKNALLRGAAAELTPEGVTEAMTVVTSMSKLAANMIDLPLNLVGFFFEMMKGVFENTSGLSGLYDWHDFSLRHYIMKII